MNYKWWKPEDHLIPLTERVPDSELIGEEKVLNSPVVEQAFQKILQEYKPRNSIAIFSLCTQSRPYIKSLKWKILDECFGDVCDLIVCSNGGIIPSDYWNCYPYLTYDAPHTPSGKWDDLYCEIFGRRLKQFLSKHPYDKCIFLFTPDTRNYKSILKNLESGWKLLPTPEMYRKTIDLEDVFIGIPRKSFGVLGVDCLLEIEKICGYSPALHTRIDRYTRTKKRLF